MFKILSLGEILDNVVTEKEKNRKIRRHLLFLVWFPTPPTLWWCSGEACSDWSLPIIRRIQTSVVVREQLSSIFLFLCINQVSFPSSKTSLLVVGPQRSALQPTIKTQQPTKWRKMKNLAVQCESCVEYLRGRVSSAPPRSLRALSGEIRPRSKCSVCKMCFL